MNNISINLSLAATIGDLDNLYALVKEGGDINQHDGEALIEAIKAQDMKMVKALVDLGANVNQQQHGQWGMPLAKAAQAGNIEILSYLLDQGADRYNLAITAATTLGKTDILKHLVGRGIAVHVQSQELTHCLNLKQGDTALYLMQIGHELTDSQVFTAVLNELHQVVDHVIYRTAYLPGKVLSATIMNTKYEYFLHGIAKRELNHKLNQSSPPLPKEKLRKI